MSPTEAARLIADIKPSGAKQFLIREHGEPIARALLDRNERLSACATLLQDMMDDDSDQYEMPENVLTLMKQIVKMATGKAGE